MATKTRKKSTGARRKNNAPWKHDAPAGASHRKLTPKKKATAKARARRAGRPYPNLVDNMRAASGRTKAASYTPSTRRRRAS
jgi:hypothetical protein